MLYILDTDGEIEEIFEDEMPSSLDSIVERRSCLKNQKGI